MKILGGLLVLAALVIFGWLLFASGTSIQCNSVTYRQASLEKAEKAVETAKAKAKSEYELGSLKLLESDAEDQRRGVYVQQAVCNDSRRFDKIGYVLGSVLGIVGILLLVKSGRKKVTPQN